MRRDRAGRRWRDRTGEKKIAGEKIVGEERRTKQEDAHHPVGKEVNPGHWVAHVVRELRVMINVLVLINHQDRCWKAAR